VNGETFFPINAHHPPFAGTEQQQPARLLQTR